MMYFKAAVHGFRKHFFLNVIMILQLSVMTAIIISLAGAVHSRLKHYLPLRNMLDENGYICNGYYDSDIKEIVNKELTGVSDVHTVGQTTMYPENSTVDTMFGGYIYDDYTVALYTPGLAEGKWLSDYSDNTGEIPIVLSSNGCGYKVGDVITMNCYLNDDSGELIEITFRVIGILKDGSDYILTDANEMLDPNSSDVLYTTYYYNRLDELTENGYSEEEAQQYLKDESERITEMMEFFDDVGYEETGNNIKSYNRPIAFIREKDIEGLNLFVSNDTLIVSLKDNLNDSEQHNDLFSLKNDVSSLQVISFSQLKKNYIQNIKLQLATSTPLIIISLVMILLSSVSMGAVSAMQQLKIYGIYYLNGSTWAKCLRVSLYNSLMICLPALVIGYSGLFALKKLGSFGELTVSFGLFENVSAALVALIFILLSQTMPLFILRRKTPKEILSENT